MIKIDITGKIFGRLKVIRFAGQRSRHSLWEVQCSCTGKVLTVYGYALVNGNTKSCGCFRTKHGATKNGHCTKEYLQYRNMLKRCYRRDCKDFKNYGGRGIQVYEPWKKGFKIFLHYLVSTIGLCPPEKSIDRIDNDGNYEPGNIKWSTPKEQANNRRPKIYVKF